MRVEDNEVDESTEDFRCGSLRELDGQLIRSLSNTSQDCAVDPQARSKSGTNQDYFKSLVDFALTVEAIQAYRSKDPTPDSNSQLTPSPKFSSRKPDSDQNQKTFFIMLLISFQMKYTSQDEIFLDRDFGEELYLKAKSERVPFFSYMTWIEREVDQRMKAFESRRQSTMEQVNPYASQCDQVTFDRHSKCSIF